jgi:Ca2+-binding RTX toxin-like protein
VPGERSHKQKEGDMPQIRHLGATMALVVAMLLVFSSVATAHSGHFGPWKFDNRWVGTAGDDEYTAPADSRDLIIGLAGNDVLDGGNKRDLIRGNAGKDAIIGGAGSDLILGGFGPDRLAGGPHSDMIIGGPGDDGINGQAGHDVIRAGRGNDKILANDGVRDHIKCGPGRDAVKADKRDRVARDCERVVRVRVAP